MVHPVHAVGRVALSLILKARKTSPLALERRPGRIRAGLDADTEWVLLACHRSGLVRASFHPQTHATR
jgi:hypothetical protein